MWVSAGYVCHSLGQAGHQVIICTVLVREVRQVTRSSSARCWSWWSGRSQGHHLHGVGHGGDACRRRLFGRVVDLASELRQVLRKLVAVLGLEVGLDVVHEVLEQLHHGALLVRRLLADQLPTELPEELIIQQYQRQQRAAHTPLVAARLEQEHVHYAAHHLLQDLRMRLNDPSDATSV